MHYHCWLLISNAGALNLTHTTSIISSDLYSIIYGGYMGYFKNLCWVSFAVNLFSAWIRNREISDKICQHKSANKSMFLIRCQGASLSPLSLPLSHVKVKHKQYIMMGETTHTLLVYLMWGFFFEYLNNVHQNS